ncbi:hypothetical protein D9V32_05815 [Mycetocola tolaasinivorans]|uniref:Uncharacterized protein n=2 Tax=Mycetocola tolaasinivorans TaxID=76635 RepID=A0A3L7A8G0_9MICO|nr:hypothetical protein D9V32_05815 [Mycetocola tolaasinivorans]
MDGTGAAEDSSETTPAVAPAQPARPQFGERVEGAQLAAATPADGDSEKEPAAPVPTPVPAPAPAPQYGERRPASQLPPPEYGERVEEAPLPAPEYGERSTDAPVFAPVSTQNAASKPSTQNGVPRYSAGSFSHVNVGGRPGAPAGTEQPGPSAVRAQAPRPGGKRPATSARGFDGLDTPPPADRFISFLLLAFGAFSVLTSVPALLNLREAFAEYYKQLGISSDGLGQAITVSGWIMLAAMVIIWALSAWWTLRRIRAGRSSWWIPVLAAVVALLVMTMIIAPTMANDPAFQDYVKTLQP